MKALSLSKLHLQSVLHFFFGLSGFVGFSDLTKLTFSSLFDFRDSCKPGPVTLSAGRGLPAQTPSRKAQLPDQPTCTLGATRIRRPQGSLQMEHQARAHLTVDKE